SGRASLVETGGREARVGTPRSRALFDSRPRHWYLLRPRSAPSSNRKNPSEFQVLLAISDILDTRTSLFCSMNLSKTINDHCSWTALSGIFLQSISQNAGKSRAAVP